MLYRLDHFLLNGRDHAGDTLNELVSGVRSDYSAGSKASGTQAVCVRAGLLMPALPEFASCGARMKNTLPKPILRYQTSASVPVVGVVFNVTIVASALVLQLARAAAAPPFLSLCPGSSVALTKGRLMNWGNLAIPSAVLLPTSVLIAGAPARILIFMTSLP